MKLTPNGELTKELDYIYKTLNDALFDGKLPYVITTPQFKVKGKSKFIQNGFEHPTTGEKYHQLLIEQELINHGILPFCEELVHQQVHLWQHTYGKSKPTDHNHNKEFITKIREIGFVSDKDYGRSVELKPTLEGKFMQAVEKVKSLKLLKPANSTAYANPVDDEKVNKGGVKFAHKCPGCGDTRYGKYEANIICGDCDLSYVRFEKK